MRLTSTAWTDQDDVLRTLNESERRQFEDLTSWRAGCESKIVGFQGLYGRKTRGSGQRLAHANASGVALRLQNILEEVGIAGIVLLGSTLGNGTVQFW